LVAALSPGTRYGAPVRLATGIAVTNPVAPKNKVICDVVSAPVKVPSCELALLALYWVSICPVRVKITPIKAPAEWS
jgi:hypothetical protein